jgi:hypothetical protein
MGLALEVGHLAFLHEEDEEGHEYYSEQFSAVNAALRANNLPVHNEPAELPGGETWGMDMLGYYGLHYLRRLAAHLAAGRQLPPPGNDDTPEDPVLQKYYTDLDKKPGGFLSKVLGKPKFTQMRFEHLINHDDSQGFYIPINFERVIVPDPRLGVLGGLVGSSNRLLEECTSLAEALDLPTDLDPESETVMNASKEQGVGDSRWERYGIESHTCLGLIHACKRSIQYGAAIVFL